MNNPIFSIVVITLSLGFSFFYVKPGYDAVQQRRIDLADIATTLKSSSEIQGLVDQTEKTLGGLDAQALSRFIVFLPETIDPLRLANNIQRIGIVHSIAVGKIKVDESSNLPQSTNSRATGVSAVAAALTNATATQKYATTKTAFTFVASDDSFKAFLSDLEKSLGLINVTSLTFIPVGENGDTTKARKTATVPQYQYEMQIETYSLK